MSSAARAAAARAAPAAIVMNAEHRLQRLGACKCRLSGDGRLNR
jgi:hypothetical protein